MESDGYILVGRLIEICLVEEMTEMGEIHKKDDTGVETHGVGATVLSKIAFLPERKVKITRACQCQVNTSTGRKLGSSGLKKDRKGKKLSTT